MLIISNKNKKTIVFVTYVKQKEYLCEKFYSYETKNIRKTRVFQSYRTHVRTWNDDCIDGPEACSLGLENTDLVEDYLDNVYNTIVLRDIIERENIRNIPLLRTLLKFVSDNIGKQFSATSIVKFLKSQNTETSAKMILTYLEYLSNAFIIDRVNRYDIHGKRLFELGDKFYFEDLGIRNHIIGGNRRFDIEKVMENAVYIHLCRMGYKVYVGQMYKAEIDFVAEKADSVAYVQVTYLLASEETVEREFGNLKLIKDSHPKYVISMDRLYSQTNIDGIKHIHLRDFLKMTTLV